MEHLLIVQEKQLIFSLLTFHALLNQNIGHRAVRIDSDDDVWNDDVMNQEQPELHSNASDIADTTLQAEYDDLDILFEEIAWRRVPNSTSCNVVTDHLTSFPHWHK